MGHRKEKAPKLSLRSLFLPLKQGLEFVTQSKLHDARVGQRTAVIAEVGRVAVVHGSGRQVAVGRLDVEADRVRYVEYFPTELKALPFTPCLL